MTSSQKARDGRGSVQGEERVFGPRKKVNPKGVEERDLGYSTNVKKIKEQEDRSKIESGSRNSFRFLVKRAPQKQVQSVEDDPVADEKPKQMGVTELAKRRMAHLAKLSECWWDKQKKISDHAEG
ncbi:hypothetical protein K7X08_012692 [Anisodus acutangulus]|uniref:Uncharacterized protein n=1 Tax=Anisodus acutangulus TaxID=402998 RepID=A0A9Q1MAH8_9SOLA|nr:hypothetical protein K7X08_012692 [Anisodus acutangulus]